MLGEKGSTLQLPVQFVTAKRDPARSRIVLVATDLSTGGGVNRVILDLAAMFGERLDCRVTVLNGRSDRPSSYPFSPTVERIDQPSKSRRAYFKALWALRRTKPDIVMGSWTQDNIILAAIFAGSSTRVIMVEHTSFGFHTWLIRALRRLAYRSADAVVVLNPTELAHYRQYLSNVHLIPNAVAPRGSRSPVERGRHVIAVGHLEPRKNFQDAIKAFAAAGIEQDGWSLTIVGDGPESRQLQDAVARLGLERVHLQAPGIDLRDYYARSSVTLVTAKLEVFSLVLAEAMAAGVVPLAYATDGPRFILADFPELLVGIGDVATLAERLRDLAAAGDLEPLRERLAQSIRERFAPDVIETLWRNLIERLDGGAQNVRRATARHTRS